MRARGVDVAEEARVGGMDEARLRIEAAWARFGAAAEPGPNLRTRRFASGTAELRPRAELARRLLVSGFGRAAVLRGGASVSGNEKGRRSGSRNGSRVIPATTRVLTVTSVTSRIASHRRNPLAVSQLMGISSRKAISAAVRNNAGNGAKGRSNWRST